VNYFIQPIDGKKEKARKKERKKARKTDKEQERAEERKKKVNGRERKGKK